MTETFAIYIEPLAAHASTWGFLLIFFFMTVESSFIPFPSEVVMIPAGFLAWRGELSSGIVNLDMSLALLAGVLGSLAGAYVNYALAVKLGRPFLRQYGKYFFLSNATLDRVDEVFLEYGEPATFVCRLLPGIRQLISIPAGLCRMNFCRFSILTAAGAGLWCLVLLAIGAYFGHLAADMSYLQMVQRGKEIIHAHTPWLLLALLLLATGYIFIHKRIMSLNTREASEELED